MNTTTHTQPTLFTQLTQEVLDELEARDIDQALFMAYIDNVWSSDHTPDWDDVINFEEAFTHHENIEDLAWEALQDCGVLEAMDQFNLSSYFDLDKFARDLMHDHFEAGGFIFRNN